MSFYETQFPTDISYGSAGGPKWKTDVVVFDSGYSSRNQRWADNQHEYDVAYGVREIEHLQDLRDFFNEMRGRTHGFRYKDWLDYQVTDEAISYDGSGTVQLTKTYGNGVNDYTKDIKKPVSGSVTLKVNGSDYTDFTVDTTTGIVTFTASPVPVDSDVVTWSGEYDIPCAFDTDQLSIVLSDYQAASTSVPVVEIRL